MSRNDTGVITAAARAGDVLTETNADLGVAVADAEDASTRRDDLRARLAAGDRTVDADNLAAAEAGVQRADLMRDAAIRRVIEAENQVAPAVLADLFDEPRRIVAKGPIAELREAEQTLKASQARRDKLIAAFTNDVTAMATRLRDAGAPHSPVGSGADGWCGRPGQFGSVLGFTAGGTTITTTDR